MLAWIIDTCKGDVMKVRLLLGILLLTLCDSPEIATSVNSGVVIPTMSGQDISDNMAYVSGRLQPRWYLINVLPHDICLDCCIPGSITIPTHLLNQKLKKWPRSRKIVIYCAGGDCPLSKYAYQILQAMGFVDISVLEGGIRAWKQQGLPMVGRCRSGYLHG